MKAPTRATGSPLFCLAIAAAVIGTAAPALARTRIAVLPFQGPAADRMRNAAVRGLLSDHDVVSLADIRKVAGSVSQPMGPVEMWQVVARKLGVSAVIKGQVTGGRRWQARLTVNQATTGASVGSVVISDGRPADLILELERTAPLKLFALVRKTVTGGPPVARRGGLRQQMMPTGPAGRRAAAGGAPVALDESALAGEAGEDLTEGPEIVVRQNGSNVPPLLEASIGPRAIFRVLTFSDNFSAVPGYRLPGAPGVAGELAYYPAARSGTWTSQVGAVGAFETSLGATTQGSPDAAPSPTRHLAYRVGLRARLPVSITTFILGADYGEQHFTLQVPDAVLSPESHYGFVRPNAAGRVAVGRFSFVLSVGYLHLLDAAGLTGPGRFPNATIRGGDAGATIGYAFDRGLQVQVGGDYRRYAYNMNAQANDALVVGGAIDEYFGLTALLTYRFR